MKGVYLAVAVMLVAPLFALAALHRGSSRVSVGHEAYGCLDVVRAVEAAEGGWRVVRCDELYQLGEFEEAVVTMRLAGERFASVYQMTINPRLAPDRQVVSAEQVLSEP